MKTLQTPLWILESIQDHGLKIRMIIIELPQHEILHYIDATGQFMEAIFNQLMQIIQTLRGNYPANVILNTKTFDKFPEFTVDEDLILLHLQKHYYLTTKTMVIPLNKNAEEKLHLFSNNVPDTVIPETNKYFKNPKILLKYNLNIIYDSDSIVFGLDGTGNKEFSPEDIKRINSKIM